MADTKISQLPAATTPLSGAEVVPLVQSGATVQTPVNDISLLTAATANTFTAVQTFTASPIISVTDNTNAALRVTQLGTGNALLIEDSTNPDSTPVVVDASGQVGIGVTPESKLHVKGVGQTTAAMSTSTNQGASIKVQDTDSVSGNGGAVVFGSGQGYFTALKAMITDGANNTLGTLSISNRNVSSDSTLTERLRLTATGDFLNVSTGGLGYGTGSGGTVTQLTSKTTGVTLNKTNGQIVTSNSLMAGGDEITFTVTNSTVAATDTIILHRASGGGAGTTGYLVYIDSVAAGSFVVYMQNLSAGNKSEAITLNFAVIKAVTS